MKLEHVAAMLGCDPADLIDLGGGWYTSPEQREQARLSPSGSGVVHIRPRRRSLPGELVDRDIDERARTESLRSLIERRRGLEPDSLSLAAARRIAIDEFTRQLEKGED